VQTGASFREQHVLASGEKVVLRHIQPSDRDELLREFRSLSPESRYRRFFGAMSDLDDRTLTYLTQVDGVNHVAIVALAESLDLKTERGIGVVRFIRNAADPKVAEMAVTVVDDMQGKGLGTLLTRTAVRAALERGIECFRCEVLAENDSVCRVLRENGAIERERSAGAFVFDIPLEDTSSSRLRRLLRLAAEQMQAFLRRHPPPFDLTPW
jgi:RimJ/RimL family protein N-acetyltransferase